MKNTEPLVSVVTPVYNGEEFIAECIESVLNQSYTNWEYIIVNNCSTDRTLEIVEEYAAQDERIIVYDNGKFFNQIPNWNNAVNKISGESKYCKVVQADDWLYPQCLERMVAIAEKYPSVGIVSSYRQIESVVKKEGLPENAEFMTGKDVGRLYFLNRNFLFGSVTTVLFRSDYVHCTDTFFDDTVVHADSHLCFDILRSSDFGFVNEVLSFTRRHNESGTTFCNYYDTYALARIGYLLSFGEYYLDKEEYQNTLHSLLLLHHRRLIRLMMAMRGKNVYRYHKNNLLQLGLSIRLDKLIRAFFAEIIQPKHTLRLLLSDIRNKMNKNNGADYDWMSKKKNEIIH